MVIPRKKERKWFCPMVIPWKKQKTFPLQSPPLWEKKPVTSWLATWPNLQVEVQTHLCHLCFMSVKGNTYGCGSKLNDRRGKPQVLGNSCFHLPGQAIWNSGFLSHSHIFSSSGSPGKLLMSGDIARLCSYYVTYLRSAYGWGLGLNLAISMTHNAICH